MINDHAGTLEAGGRPHRLQQVLRALEALFIASIVAGLGLRTVHAQVSGLPDDTGWLRASRIALDAALVLGVLYVAARALAPRDATEAKGRAAVTRPLRRPRAMEVLCVVAALAICVWQYLEGAPGGVVRAVAPWALVAFGITVLAWLRGSPGDGGAR